MISISNHGSQYVGFLDLFLPSSFSSLISFPRIHLAHYPHLCLSKDQLEPSQEITQCSLCAKVEGSFNRKCQFNMTVLAVCFSPRRELRIIAKKLLLSIFILSLVSLLQLNWEPWLSLCYMIGIVHQKPQTNSVGLRNVN